MKSKPSGGIIFLAAGMLMFAAAILLVCYNIYDDYRAGEAAGHVLEKLQQQMPAPVIQETDSPELPDYITNPDIDMPTPDIPAPSPLELPDYIINPDMEMPTMEIENNDYIGILEIPSLELSLPVMSRWSYAGLKIALCRYSGSAYKGNLVIAGHNYRAYFKSIENLAIGAQVIFTDVTGQSFFYEVTALETLQAADVEEVLSTEWDLTLFTCTVSGKERIAVRCLKV